MTWAQDQRIAFIKERIDAGEKVNRRDLREKFHVTIQTATSTFHAFERRYPGLMRYCARTKAMVPASWVPDADVDWKTRALAAEAKLSTAHNALETFAIMANAETAHLPDEHVVSLTYDDSALDAELGGPNTLLGERVMRAFRVAAKIVGDH